MIGDTVWLETVDTVISTLPFTLFSEDLIKDILLSIQKSLKLWGNLIVVQYFNTKKQMIWEMLTDMKLIHEERERVNVPPAKIFTYQKV